MALPIEDEALRADRGGAGTGCPPACAADDHMIAAAGAGMAAIDHEFVGAEPRLPRFLVKRHRRVDRFAPARGRMDVDLDHARIGRDLEHVDARVGRRRIAFDMHRQQFRRGRLDGGEQLEIVLQPLDRRHEDGHAPSRASTDRAVRTCTPSALVADALCRATSCVRSITLREFVGIRQRAALLERIGRDDMRIILRRNLGSDRAAAETRPENRPAAEKDARAAISSFR